MPPLILPDFECLPSSALVPPGLPLPPLFWNHLIPLTSAFRQLLCLSLRGRLCPTALRLHLRLYHHRFCHHLSSPWPRQGNPSHGSSLLRHLAPSFSLVRPTICTTLVSPLLSSLGLSARGRAFQGGGVLSQLCSV